MLSPGNIDHDFPELLRPLQALERGTRIIE
jgi:hypothetical protein